MAFEFHIPLTFEELLHSGGIDQYVVQEVLPVRQLSSQLGTFQTASRGSGPLAILDHFDSIYSILHHFRTINLELKEDTLELLVKVLSRHATELPVILEDLTLSSADRSAHLNALKMNCYLLTQLVEAFESETYKTGLVNLEAGGRGKKGKSKAGGFDWEAERERVLQAILQLVQLEIRRLWSLSVVEEEFVSMLTGCCYKILENPSISQAKNKPTRDVVAHLLGVMVKRYNHMLSASLKIIQMLQHFEHLAPILVHAVSLWATDFGMKTIVGEIMREIGQKSPQELARETSGVKAYSSFLTELGEQIPAIMIPSISVLLDHLDGESYMMRNAVLSLMSEMVIRVLSGDQMDEAARRTRDQFLDSLQDHMHDVHAFVRSKVLQILSRVVQEKALPLSRFHNVVALTVGRLHDKSVNVCKNAIQLLATFLANNPFTCKLSSADLREPLEKETLKLRELKEKLRAAAPVAVITPEEEWEAMLPEVQSNLQILLQGPPQEEEEQVDGIGEDETAQQVSERITHLLKKTNYKHAIALVQKATQHFKDSILFLEKEGQQETQILGILEKLFTGKQGGAESATVELDQPDTAPESSENEPAATGSPKVQSTAAPPVEQSELVKQEMLVQYLKDAYSFALKIEEAINVISKMMYETAVSVVQEVIDFFVTVSQFGVAQALLGVRRMLPLVWSKDPAVKEAVLGAYRRLYLSPSGESERARAQSLVHNLSLLIVDASLSTIQCLEEIVSEFVLKDEIRPAVIQHLWERFTEKSACSPLERKASVLLLGMMARGRPEIVGSNMDTLVTVGLGEKVHEDYGLAREVCNTILKIGDSQKQTLGKSKEPFRLSQEHQLFDRLTEAVVGGISQPSHLWLPFTETAITVIYQLSEEPETICAKILKRCSKLVLEQLEGATAETPEAADEGRAAEPPTDPKDLTTVPTFLLAHLLSLAGNVALQEVVHLERSVSAELRRRRVIKEDQEAKKSADKQKKQKGDESTMEEELGLVGACADDTEAELIRKICESELLADVQYLSAFVPLILKVCNSPGRYSNPDLCTAASLALAKFMMINSDFCDAHLRLLFTMLEKSSLPSVRSNIMIALGDLSIRFPNLIEPWTPHLYARLRDDSHSVRKTAGMVMTHLILKDMVKVKGQVSEMAVLVIDPEAEISALARNFFNELSNKGNAVYNLLPDIISRLSDPECGVEEEPFQTIMKQLLSYITKDKQTESLVEKLCQRFRTARTERQWRDLAHCLTLLPFSERGLRKMQENFECFGDKLTEDMVFNSFVTVVGKMRRGAKPELKVLIDEFEQKLRACHSRGMENMEDFVDTQEGAMPPPPTAAKSAKKNPTGKRRPLSTRNANAQNEEDDFTTPKPRASRKGQTTRKKLAVSFSSDEESEEEDMEAEMSEAETPKNTTPIRRTSTRTTKAK
ncbi:condensin complex subunit 1 isoform X2 [Ambystoma mexicanum]|uniref:condensin complex subunit 1 isoform X2 n=1 Tax=Ambystoma mexicanum TaxID=8296 RepID=UPI0037E76D9F